MYWGIKFSITVVLSEKSLSYTFYNNYFPLGKIQDCLHSQQDLITVKMLSPIAFGPMARKMNQSRGLDWGSKCP